MLHQLRIYELTEQGKTEFPARFGDHAARIMARYDFKIVGAWEEPDAEPAKFLYILEWPDEATMKAGWNKFLSDEEWLGIRSSAKLVDGVEDHFLNPLALNSP